MPCIQIKTNVSVDERAAEAVKSGLGEAISCLPGKSEQWLMVTLEDGCRMWFGGESGRPMAVVEVKVLGSSIDSAASAEMTRKVTPLVERELGVAPSDLYVRYVATPDWGWNGDNF